MEAKDKIWGNHVHGPEILVRSRSRRNKSDLLVDGIGGYSGLGWRHSTIYCMDRDRALPTDCIIFLTLVSIHYLGHLTTSSSSVLVRPTEHLVLFLWFFLYSTRIF